MQNENNQMNPFDQPSNQPSVQPNPFVTPSVAPAPQPVQPPTPPIMPQAPFAPQTPITMHAMPSRAPIWVFIVLGIAILAAVGLLVAVIVLM